jgi:nuclear pore complex protein Nup160
MFQNGPTIRYGKQDIHLPAATSIASPKTSIDGMSYAFMVSLDHRLRVWNLTTGKLAYMGDLLNQELEPHENAKQVVHPSYSQLIRVYGNNDESALCVTYSPLGTGQFKFWDVNPAEDGNIEVADLFPHITLEPQAPSSEIWTLADFSVTQDRTTPRSYTLWTLWKNNITFRVQKLDFESGSISRIREAWTDDWTAMATETLTDAPLPTAFCGDPSDVTDKWLEFILSPGRFTKATVETGLAIYERGLGSSKDSSRRSGSLPERLCSTIASTVSLGRTSDGNMDYEQFRTATDTQWRRFFRLLSELNGQRGEALSLALDPQGGMPWVVLADGITAVRDCSALERIWHNNSNVPAGTEHVARLILAAANFRDSLSDQFLYNCKAALLDETLEEPSLTDPARMRVIYSKCDFANQIGDEEYSQLVVGLAGGFKDVTPHVYGALVELLNGSEELDRRPQLLPLAENGNKLIVRGVQETVELHRNICIDQLILLVLIEVEINHGEEGIAFESAAAFSQLLTTLKRLELIHWLSNTQISLPLKSMERSNSISDSTSSLMKKQAPRSETITVLEGVLRHLFGLDLHGDENMSSAVTEIIVQICSPNSEYEAPPAVIQCFLLKHDRVDLAMEFSRFADHDAFSTYIQGRACLAANDANTAAMLFKKAAFGMGMCTVFCKSIVIANIIPAYPDPKKRTDYRSAGYLDETERRLLNAGLSEYYSHIVYLFDKNRFYSFVIDFARLSLQFIKSGTEDIETSKLRTEMHSRLFNAAIQTARYEIAHSILALFTDSALQHSSLRTLVAKMCECNFASELVDLPFISLQDTVDDILAQKCQSIVDVTIGVPYHKILYAWRIKRSDFRGAAAISLERLQRLQQSGDGDKILGDDGLETPITRQYVALINALSCVDPKQAWILSEELPKKGAKGQPKRSVVTLEDIRRAYQEELDRIAAIENNQFAFVGGDEMDVLQLQICNLAKR